MTLLVAENNLTIEFSLNQVNLYYYNIALVGQEPLEKGLVKIITNPGGTMGTVAYESTIYTEERVSEVFFRPNY